MVTQVDEQEAAVVADAMTPAGKPDVGAVLGEGQGAAGVGAVAMHDCLSFSLRAALRRCLAEIGRAGKREVGGASGVQGLRVDGSRWLTPWPRP